MQNIAYGTPHSRTTSEADTAGSVLRRRRLTLPFLLVALFTMGVSMFLLLPNVFAQDASTVTYTYAEGGTDPVATFTATDPEGATPIAWDIVEGAGDPDGVDGDLEVADNADAASFEIDKDGMLKFSSPPDFENPAATNATDNTNTYKVVVVACDVALDNNACPDAGKAGYHAVTVKVTNMDESGTVTLATSTVNGTPQYLVGATLTATAKDGDITATTQTFTANVPDEVNGVTWRWYRGSTEIADANANTYILVQADAGQHIRAVVFYVVDGNVDQESALLTTDYPVLAARIGANVLKFDPATASRTISEGAKDRNVGAPVTATDNHGTVRYSLDAGGDAVRFKIDEKTGQITTIVVLDYEGEGLATADDAGSCEGAGEGSPDRECTVTVTAFDSTGDDPTNTAAVTITITDVDEKPAFSTGEKIVSVPENSTALWDADTTNYNQNAVIDVTYTAMDPERRTVSYSLAGPDASKFQLSSDPPILSFVSGPDFEAKASADRDNVYEVTVRTSVGGDTGERMVRVTVGDVDEAPDVSGPSTRNFAENGKGAVATFTADDPEGATPITWSLLGIGTPGDIIEADYDIIEADYADAAHFDIDKNGVLTFDVGDDGDTGDASAAPDFENPPDTNATENTYNVVVAAADAEEDGQTGYHKVTVKVTQVNEPGTVTLVTSTDNGTPQYLVGATLTATAKDGDITNTTQTTQTFTADVTNEVSGVTWRWYRGGAEITDAQGNTYALVQADANNRIRVVVTYQVDGNVDQESALLTTDYPVLAARIGDNVLKFDPATASRTISEGAKDRNVGAPVTATDNHGTVRYSLVVGGDAERFKINEKTGQITTIVVLDYEGETAATAADAGSCEGAGEGSPDRECTVTVTAFDSTGETPTNAAAVTIAITDADEKPAFSTGAKTVSVPENSTALWGPSDNTNYNQNAVIDVTYTAMDPEERTVTYSLTGPDASKFQISGSPPVLSFVSGPDFESPGDSGSDNVYNVTVEVTDSEGNTAQRAVTVKVTNTEEMGTVELSTLQPRITLPQSSQVTLTDADNGNSEAALPGSGTRGYMWRTRRLEANLDDTDMCRRD